jgi:hypothetical protein
LKTGVARPAGLVTALARALGRCIVPIEETAMPMPVAYLGVVLIWPRG